MRSLNVNCLLAQILHRRLRRNWVQSCSWTTKPHANDYLLYQTHNLPHCFFIGFVFQDTSYPPFHWTNSASGVISPPALAIGKPSTALTISLKCSNRYEPLCTHHHLWRSSYSTSPTKLNSFGLIPTQHREDFDRGHLFCNQVLVEISSLLCNTLLIRWVAMGMCSHSVLFTGLSTLQL